MKGFGLLADERAATLIEYALLVGLFAAVIITAGQIFGTALQGVYLRLAQTLGSA